MKMKEKKIELEVEGRDCAKEYQRLAPNSLSVHTTQIGNTPRTF